MSGTKLNARVAVVTGSGRGLGRAYAEALAAAGAGAEVWESTFAVDAERRESRCLRPS